ncbi:zinc-binding domain-containing protein [Xylariaceae sp. FL0255]|nr:zinc-binding domain-containing protein [Xylariaceae sp. FL0255]
MAKPKKKQRNKPKQTWSMYPSLDPAVASILLESDLIFPFRAADDNKDMIAHHDTHVKGRFNCKSTICGRAFWSSKMVGITIRIYPNNEYNVRVWRQRCNGCKQLCKPTLDDTYANRVAAYLMEWSGSISKAPPPREKSRGPHNSRLYEGCKHGHCKRGAKLDKDNTS